MSCFRCGKELPEFQTECDPPCDEPSVGQRVFTVEIRLNEKKLAADPAGFERAAHRFGDMLIEAILKSGLADFCKTREDEG